MEPLNTFEEDVISKNSILDLPVIFYARDAALRGERLNDPVMECLQEITDKDMRNIHTVRSNQKEALNRGMLPGGLYGPTKAVGSFALEVAQDDHLRAPSDAHLSLFPSFFSV